MKVLFIGGTGTISMAITRQLLASGNEVWLLNRGNRNDGLAGKVHFIKGDNENDPEGVKEADKGETFDVIANFIVKTKAQAERDVNLFSGKCRQYMTLSSCAAYQKPLSHYVISESTPLSNPFQQYGRDKIEVENVLNRAYRESGFPITIVRPSHTYDERKLPLAIRGNGNFAVIRRMLEGKPVLIQGDGTSLWTVTHNSDFAKGFIGLMMNIHAIGETVHITSDESVTWNQIYAVIADELGVELKPYHVASDFLASVSNTADIHTGLLGDKSPTVVFDNSKIKRLVPGFVCTVRMDQGIRDTVRWILAHPEAQVDDPEFDAWCDRVIAALDRARAELQN